MGFELNRLEMQLSKLGTEVKRFEIRVCDSFNLLHRVESFLSHLETRPRARTPQAMTLESANPQHLKPDPFGLTLLEAFEEA
jgi:hypothetical protein